MSAISPQIEFEYMFNWASHSDVLSCPVNVKTKIRNEIKTHNLPISGMNVKRVEGGDARDVRMEEE